MSPKGDGSEWIGFDVEAEHNWHYPADRYRDGNNATTSYTGIVEVEPGTVLLAYDKISGIYAGGDLQKVFSVRIDVDIF